MSGRLDAQTTGRTARLWLDRPVPDDIDAVGDIHSDPRTNRFNPAGPLRDRAAAEEMVGAWITHWNDHGFGYWVVRDASGVVGMAGVRVSEWAGRDVVNLAYRFAPVVWGRGYATEAATAGVELWRAHLAAHPVIAYTKPGNIGSQRTALAVGLERRRDLDQPTDDALGDDIVFALGW